MSMPRAAMSVATMARAWPLRNASSERSLWPWLLLPWIAQAAIPLPSRCWATLSAPRLVLVKTIVRVISASAKSSTRRSRLRLVSTSKIRWLIRSAVFAAGVTDTSMGSTRSPPASAGNFVWHRRREKRFCRRFGRVLAIRRMAFHKTEVEHAIGLVEDENFGLAKARRPAIEVIFETARGRDQNVEATREGLNLRTMRHAAEDNGSGEGKARAKTPEALGDLTRQFACRTQNQHAAAIARGGAIMRCEIMENGKREGRRLAGAVWAMPTRSRPAMMGGMALRLDRRGMRVTLFGQGMEKRRGETEPGEFSQFQSFLKRELAHLKRACPLMAGGCAGKTGAAAREFQGDAPRGWAVEGSN